MANNSNYVIIDNDATAIQKILNDIYPNYLGLNLLLNDSLSILTF